ncbi:MAG: hypothetical protein ACODAJ_10000 [Planctomycetota bacterium]
MRDTHRYGTAFAGRVEFGRQAAVVSVLAPLLAAGLGAADLLIIRDALPEAALIAAFVACFLDLVGLGLGFTALHCFRHKRHERYRVLAIVGIAGSLVFLAAFVIACVVLRHHGAG